ncbi:MAG: hypothetical protein GDA53_09115 [Rhodobacteraceae bacterium]|nr:hypothetical protein [Paracoccaceae bacterium]
MYALLPWKTLGTGLMIVVGLAVYADDFGAWIGVTVSDSAITRYLPMAVLAVLGIVFGLTAYWAPWRYIWRKIPQLNRMVFPDLNGVWVGTTASNWPTIEKMRNAAVSDSAIELAELHETAERHDAIAVEITASLYSFRLATGLSSMDATSYSITARPWKCQHTPGIHLAYVYEQETKDPSATDEERHMGAADLVYDPQAHDDLEGVYWTRRSWIDGLNTAGRLRLRRVSSKRDPAMSLRDYALREKVRLET